MRETLLFLSYMYRDLNGIDYYYVINKLIVESQRIKRRNKRVIDDNYSEKIIMKNKEIVQLFTEFIIEGLQFERN